MLQGLELGDFEGVLKGLIRGIFALKWQLTAVLCPAGRMLGRRQGAFGMVAVMLGMASLDGAGFLSTAFSVRLWGVILGKDLGQPASVVVLTSPGTWATRPDDQDCGLSIVVRDRKSGGSRFVVPTLSTIELWKGWGTQLCGVVKCFKNLGCATRRRYCTSIAETIASPFVGLNSRITMPSLAFTSKRWLYAVSAPPAEAATSILAKTFCPFAKTSKMRSPGCRDGSTNVRTTLCGPSATGTR